jgi:hypothetical protein
MKIRIALAIAGVVALGAATTARAHTTSSPCTLLSTRQIAAVHVDTGCKVLHGKPNPLYNAVTATWGKAGGQGSVLVAIYEAKSDSYVTLWKTSHLKGTSWGVGSWSRAMCVNGGLYCYVTFIVGSNIVVLQVAPPAAKPISVIKPSKAMAKTVAGKLS